MNIVKKITKLKNYILPGGVPSLLPNKFIISASGSRCWDDNGKSYIDFVSGYGSIILGHANYEIIEAIKDQLKIGIILPAINPLQLE